MWARLQVYEKDEHERELEEKNLEERRLQLRETSGVVEPRILPGPEAPSDLEREMRNLTHLPPARWCEWCVLGRAVEPPHLRANKADDEKHAVPLISMAFAR